jgi:hypothetical protein
MAKAPPPETEQFTLEETRRRISMELAIDLHNFRSDITRDTERVIADAKRIIEYLEIGT